MSEVKCGVEARRDLALTKLYNVPEKVRPWEGFLTRTFGPTSPPRGEVKRQELTEAQTDIRDRGQVLILKDLHDAEAGRWSARSA